MCRLIRAVAVAGALALMLAACGGDAESTSPTLPTLNEQNVAAEAGAATTTTEAVDPEDAFQEYAACMQEHGVELPDPGDANGGVIAIDGGEGMDFDAFEEAAAECDPILEAAFGEFELSPEQEAEMMDQELALAQCMRDNGVAWPDPSGDNNAVIELGDNLDPETVNAAMEVCMRDSFGEGGFVIGGDGS